MADNGRPDNASALALALLSRARRSAAHEVNNLLAVIHGNQQLLTGSDATDRAGILAEMDLACRRLSLMSDEWMLAGEQGMRPAGHCIAGEVICEIAELVRSTLETIVNVSGAREAMDASCASDARALGAMAHCIGRTMIRASGRQPLDIRLAVDDGVLVVDFSCECEPGSSPSCASPVDLLSNAGAEASTLHVGLWEMSQALQARGGTLGVDRDGSRLRVRLGLPLT